MAATSSAKKPGKSAPKKKRKSSRPAAPKAAVKSLPRDLVEWVKKNHGQETAKAAIEKFGVSYAHLTDWLKKEGHQVKEAVETLIEARKKAALKKGRAQLKRLEKAVKGKKKS